MKVIEQIRMDGKKGYVFWCPGCKEGHAITVPPWTFNGDFEKPTIRASVLVHSQVYPSGTHFPNDEEHARMMNGETLQMTQTVCHSFVTEGSIQFFDDCTHELKGKTVPLGDIGSEGEDGGQEKLAGEAPQG